MQTDKDEAIKDVKLYLASGWNLKSETPDYYVLSKSATTGLGHLIVFILTFPTAGIGNIIYALVAKKTLRIMK
jgi:hypothetical protein